MTKDQILEYEMDQLGLVIDAELTSTAYDSVINAMASAEQNKATIFAEWTCLQGWVFDKNTGYWIISYAPKQFKTEKASHELYELFEQHQKINQIP